ncbi:hypothetical protein DN38_3042 [Vibrio cholerae]|nr:hypothetical protein DN38_3042 [Vibrio cholerae]
MLEQIINDLSGFALITCQFMKADRLGDDVKNLHPRVHRGVRVLEYHLHLTTQWATFVLRFQRG